ncbi:MAG: HEAT repeat domain-containing protein [Vicinamibacterales bacterium]
MPLFFFALLLLLNSVQATAQIATAPSPRTGAALQQAEAALAAGDRDGALAAIEPVLEEDPANRTAVALKIRAHAAKDEWEIGLAAYEAWLAVRNTEDATLLEPIGRAALRRLEADAPQFTIQAWERLACVGDADSERKLRSVGATGPYAAPTVLHTVALARLGDPAAIAELRRLASLGSRGERAMALGAIGALDSKAAEGLVVAALQDKDPSMRLVAIGAARHLADAPVRGPLRALLEDRVLLMQLEAAGELFRRGDASVRPRLEEALKSEFPDAQLTAARALANREGDSWRTTALALLDSRDGLFRLDAADILLQAEPAKARAVLDAAAADANPVVRAAAVRLLLAKTQVDLPTLRTWLKDASPATRIEAAGRLAGPDTRCKAVN